MRLLGIRLQRNLWFAIVLLTSSLLASCQPSESTEKLRLAALALNNSSVSCVEEVKTLKVKYETAPSCVALQALAKTYADLGGFGLNIPKEIEVVAERARVYAWMARAISASGDPHIAIWYYS